MPSQSSRRVYSSMTGALVWRESVAAIKIGVLVLILVAESAAHVAAYHAHLLVFQPQILAMSWRQLAMP